MRFGFYVSNNATRLKKTLRFIGVNNTFNNLLNDIAFVYRDNMLQDELQELCNIFKINYYRKDLSRDNKLEKGIIISNELYQLMNQFSVDYLFVFGERILKGELIKVYKNKIINFHPSILPSFPGINSIDQAINYGSFITGNTAHLIEEGIDTGQIVMQNFYIINGDVEYDKILDKQIPMLIQLMVWLKEERLIIDGRKVRIKDAKYNFENYIPNLELKEFLVYEGII